MRQKPLQEARNQHCKRDRDNSPRREQIMRGKDLGVQRRSDGCEDGDEDAALEQIHVGDRV